MNNDMDKSNIITSDMEQSTNTDNSQDYNCTSSNQEKGNNPKSIEDNTAKAKGRFKDSEELLNAYTNLEREFTKRSQRLSKLESEAKNAKDNQAIVDDVINRMAEVNPELGEWIAQAAQDNSLDTEGQSMSKEARLARALSGRIIPCEQGAKQNYIDRLLDNDESLRQSVLSKLLDNLPAANYPQLNKNRGQMVLTPPSRPKNLSEAGKMAQTIIGKKE